MFRSKILTKGNPNLLKLTWGFLVLAFSFTALPDALSQESSALSHRVNDQQVESALEKAGNNRPQIQAAINQTPAEQLEAMRFLVAYMPPQDLQSLSATFLLENVEHAFLAREKLPWGSSIPEEVFFNDVLPYASINERRDNWRKDFLERFLPLVKNASTPGEAGQILNRDIFKILNVQYHARKRPKPDQSPYESIEASYASCSGLSILLIDACRAVCVPARFAGTPRWANKRGNHSWVEIWDDGKWNFTGACEYNSSGLNKTWFQNDASHAIKEDRNRAIYASSWKHTGTSFPLVWDREIDYVAAVNVTDSYTGAINSSPKPSEMVLVAIQLWDRKGGERVARKIKVKQDQKTITEGTTKGPSDDSNNWLEIRLRKETDFVVEIANDEIGGQRSFSTTDEPRQKWDIYLNSPSQAGALPDPRSSAKALLDLERFVVSSPAPESSLGDQSFAKIALTRNDASKAADVLWSHHASKARKSRAAEMESKSLKLDGLTMSFEYFVYGEKPDSGRSLFISMHGGGGAPARVNDRQWENQKKLYQPEEGVYVAPRAPTDTWNLWHQGHIDQFFQRLIENMVIFEDVNPDRVYIMGYSAGGDGVFQLAPRMADRWAAAAMMAGHPNETSPLGLRNIGFILQMGGEDAAYKRNQVAREWKVKLADLRTQDPQGYPHKVIIYEGLGHWMQKKDVVALPWMADFQRNPHPDTIVWKQDDVIHDRFYWIAVATDQAKPRSLIKAQKGNQTITVESEGSIGPSLLLHDNLVDLDLPVSVRLNGELAFQGLIPRTIAAMELSLSERLDPNSLYWARLSL